MSGFFGALGLLRDGSNGKLLGVCDNAGDSKGCQSLQRMSGCIRESWRTGSMSALTSMAKDNPERSDSKADRRHFDPWFAPQLREPMHRRR